MKTLLLVKPLLVALAGGLLLASCAPSTPQARIAQDPQRYAALSAKHQALVQQGQITRGMSTDAVYLAWGSPSASFQGSKDGKLTERWDYSGTRPVPVSSFYGSYGYGYGHGYGRYGPYGPYGRHGYHSSMGFGFGPEFAYIAYRRGSVWFINHRVDAWERAR